MAFDPVEEIKRFHGAINALDFETIENYFAEDATYVSNGVGSLSGRADIMVAFRKYFDDYPDQTAIDTLVERSARMPAAPYGRFARRTARRASRWCGRAKRRSPSTKTVYVTHVEVTDYQAF